MKVLPIIITAIAAIALQGCFTGVDSTPRITAGDVKREVRASKPEDSYFDSVTAEPFSQWANGKSFYVTDPKIRLLFGTSLPNGIDLTGAEIQYAGVRESPSITGTTVSDLMFVSDVVPADTLTYRVSAPLSSLMNRNYNVEIPFTVEEALVNKARNALLDSTFYILTRNRLTANDEMMHGRKFVAVTIDSVMPGTAVNPVKISFVDSDGVRGWLLLAAGGSSASPRTFASLFSFTNPRKNYPSISDDVWNLIMDGKVADGMTRDECRLSLGAPSSVQRAPGYNYMHEMWSYAGGSTLFFQDGILVKYRH